MLVRYRAKRFICICVLPSQFGLTGPLLRCHGDRGVRMWLKVRPNYDGAHHPSMNDADKNILTDSL